MSIFDQNSLTFNVVKNLCVNSPDCESLTVQLKSNKKSKSKYVTSMYKPPAAKFENFSSFVTMLYINRQ